MRQRSCRAQGLNLKLDIFCHYKLILLKMHVHTNHILPNFSEEEMKFNGKLNLLGKHNHTDIR